MIYLFLYLISQLVCCGVESYEDWSETSLATKDTFSVPASCCRANKKKCHHDGLMKNSTAVHDIHTQVNICKMNFHLSNLDLCWCYHYHCYCYPRWSGLLVAPCFHNNSMIEFLEKCLLDLNSWWLDMHPGASCFAFLLAFHHYFLPNCSVCPRNIFFYLFWYIEGPTHSLE